MLKINQCVSSEAQATATLTLPFDQRQKSRLRVTLDNGVEAGLLLPRGTVLRDGLCLRADNGLVVRVKAAVETVSTASSDDALTLARACYHLGNRHVPLQIGDNWLRYVHDHVLDAMLMDLGLEVICEQAPFEPEAGAYYHNHGHDHAHNHTNSNAHGHEH